MRHIGCSLLFLLASFSSLSLSAQAPRVIEIVATDQMTWNVSKITAKRGEAVRIKLVSKGVIPKVAMAHNFVLLKSTTSVQKFVDAGASARATDFVNPAMKGQVLAATKLAGPGETVWVDLKAPATPGAYPYVCTFAGHYQAGMKGTLTVR